MSGPAVIQVEPASVTRTRLLLADELNPMFTLALVTMPPLLIRNSLPPPEFPRPKKPPIRRTEFEFATNTELLVEVELKPRNAAELDKLPPLVTSNWQPATLRPTSTLDDTVVLLPARTSQKAAVLPLAPRSKVALLAITPPRVISVPPLNSNKPAVLVMMSWSRSIIPAFSRPVPRRTSSSDVPAVF